MFQTVEDFISKMLFAIIVGLLCWCNLSRAQTVNNTGTNLSSKSCALIDVALNAQGDSCQCFETVERDKIEEDEYEEINGSRLYPWIGCTRERMPAIYRSLNALQNNTILDKLWIWDSLIPLVPAKFFAKIRVHKLILENDHLGEFASGAVAPLARHLRQLIVKNNIIKEINAEMFENLHRLRLLDLSRNMIGELNERSFGDHMKNLHTLSLYDNKIQSLLVGTFEKMKNLRKLNIAANRLTSLDGNIFRNLHKLEYLSLENNQITYINSNVLIDLMNLKVLNLGGNFLNSLTIPMSMTGLSQLYLNNNSFFTVSHLNIEASSFSNLQMLNLDENHLVSLENDQFSKFAGLQVLSVTSNELTSLREHCLRNLHNLTVLSLQNNRIDDASLSSEVLFSNSLRLEKLYLSTNSLTRIESKTFGKLSELKVLSLAHNQIHTIDADALIGLTSLEKLYLNDNFLKNLHNSTFDLAPSSLYTVDLSGESESKKFVFLSHKQETFFKFSFFHNRFRFSFQNAARRFSCFLRAI